MRRERRTNIYFSLFGLMVFSMVLTACGARGEAVVIVDHADYAFRQEIIIPDIEPEKEVQESTPEEDTVSDIASEDEVQEPASDDEVQEPTPNEDGSMEIYSAREIISLSDDMIVGQVSLEDILEGNPILYDRVIIDGYVVEWILTDYEDEESILIEEGVLVISEENNAANTQVIRAQGRGGAWGPPASLNNKFEYMDVNFDDIPDLLICAGHHGNQGAVTYYCFLQTDEGFVEAPTFTDIPNPSVDTENKLILSQWRNNVVSHSWAEYKYQDYAYIRDRALREDGEKPEGGKDASDYIWVWTVNGEEIGRNDELSESEIEDLLYSENSEWRLADDRWRTIYNNGMMLDFSIYNSP